MDQQTNNRDFGGTKKAGSNFEHTSDDSNKKIADESGTDDQDLSEDLDKSGAREFSPPSTKPEIDPGRYSQNNEESANEQNSSGNVNQGQQVGRTPDLNANQANPG